MGILVILAFGCESETNFSEPPVEFNSKKLDSFLVSEDLAKQIALGFFKSDSSFIAARKGGGTPKIRQVSRVALTDSVDFEAYVVNESEGFVIIAGDTRIMPIMAYSSVGELKPEDFQEVNGLKVWYQQTMSQIDNELKTIKNVHPIVYKEWKKYNQGFDTKGRIWENIVASNYNSNCEQWYQYGQFMCNPYMSVYERQPLYSTQISWGQSGISNFYAPTNSSCTCSKSPIGCGPVAIAQTLWHFKPGNYSYTSMPTYSNSSCFPAGTGEYSLASLMHNSALAANTSFNFFGCNGMTTPSNISSALVTMGLQSGGSSSSFNPWLLNNELYQGYPAIFSGYDNLDQWHRWTCDGFKQHNYKAYDCDIDGCVEWSYTWYYMNWGWNGSSNGWFGSGNFAPNGSLGPNYNNGLKMITGIR
ncbi:C10 family peptidase [Algoriphagus aquaeductus]|uniref:C10 family peptidase n=1 Tax=Algoriphagus aquaeductus TaxID=475299 RepID=UPI003918AC68